MRSAVTILIVCMFAASVRADDWPQWLGPNRDGVSRETGWDATRLDVGWHREIGQGYSAVSVVGDRVYATGNVDGKDTVWCLDAADGHVVWKHDYVCRGGGAGYPGTRMQPLVEDGRVFTMSLKGELHCYEAVTGRPVWRVDAAGELGAKGGRHGFSCHPVKEGKRLFVELGARGGDVVALDAATGKVLWQSGRYDCGHSSPVLRTLGGKRQLIVWTAQALVGMNPDDGKELWTQPTKVQYGCNIPTPVFSGESVFISSVYYDRGSTLVDLSHGKLRTVWHSKVLQGHCSPSIVYEDHLYGFDGWVDDKKPGKGVLKCVELRTGRERWSQKGFGTGSLMIADGKLIIQGDRGLLAVAEADPRGFKQISSAEVLSGRCWNMPVLANGRV
ncbi:MAG TPA: PQQ-binding-like beta-propeller repeat protein, partial [Planctomycetota bacterium]|nr:PQQ-binding-like beta-propeller repeat protein [Planctomycetota bacterium]